MTKEPALLRFGVDEPHQATLRALRREFTGEGLRVPAELDIGGRIRKELGAGVAPCVVLYVDDPAVLLEAVVFHRGAPLLIPKPVVVTGDGRRTEVLVLSLESLIGEIPASVRDPLLDLHNRIVRAVMAVAEKQAVYVPAGS